MFKEGHGFGRAPGRVNTPQNNLLKSPLSIIKAGGHVFARSHLISVTGQRLKIKKVLLHACRAGWGRAAHRRAACNRRNPKSVLTDSPLTLEPQHPDCEAPPSLPPPLR